MALSRVTSMELRWRLDPDRIGQADASSGDPLPKLIDRLHASIEAALAGAATERCHLFIRHGSRVDAEELFEHAVARIESTSSNLEDYCFVHNFSRPDQPRLLRLPAGGARTLENELREISRFIRDELEGALQSRPIRNRMQALDDRSDVEMRRATASLEGKLKPHGLVLVREQVGQLVRLTIHVQQTGRVITQDDLANLVAKGQVSVKEFEQIREVVRDSQPDLREVTGQINEVWKNSRQLGTRLLRAESRRLLANLSRPLLETLDDPEVRHQVDCIIADVLEKRVGHRTTHLADPELLYSANPVHVAGNGRLPVVREIHPTPRNLGGTIDPSWLESGRAVASFRGIRGGSLLRAHGGLLVVDAGALLDQPDSIRLLVNALGYRRLSIEAVGNAVASPAISLQPDPVPFETRLVVMGSFDEWQQLQRQQPDFARLLRPPFDLPDTIERNPAGIAWLGDRMTRTGERLGLPQATPEAIAALIEQAARRGGAGRLSTRIAVLGDLLCDAATLCRIEGDSRVTAVHVHRAIGLARPRHRAGSTVIDPGQTFPARQHQLGQVYVGGLAADGELDYGQVLRIQAGLCESDSLALQFDGTTQSPGTGFQTLLVSLLGQILKPARPIRTAIALRVDCESGPMQPGKQASLLLGSLLAVLSRASNIPLRQDLMIIGSVDLDGRLMPVSGLNEQIEDACRVATDRTEGINAGVVIPAVQRKSLMLEPEVIQAVGNDLFQVHAAGNLVQVLELLIGSSPGVWRDGSFTEASMLGRARTRLSGAG